MEDTEIGDRGWLGNPYRLQDGYSRRQSVDLFKRDFIDRVKTDQEFAEAVRELHGQRLGCWCQQLDEEDGDLCHGEVIADVADILADLEKRKA